MLCRGFKQPQPQVARFALQVGQLPRRRGVGVVLQGVFNRFDLFLHEAANGVTQHHQFLWQFPSACGVVHIVSPCVCSDEKIYLGPAAKLLRRATLAVASRVYRWVPVARVRSWAITTP